MGKLVARKTSFYYAFLVLPGEQRRAIIAVWDFCRAVDDAVDESPASLVAAPGRRAAIESWRAELARCYDGSTAETPQGRRLQPFIRQFDLRREFFDDLIDGVAMDLDTTRYRTFADLFEYCRRVASAVGFICIQVFGCASDAAREYALIWASPFSSRTSSATFPATSRAVVSTCRSTILMRAGARWTTSRGAVRPTRCAV